MIKHNLILFFRNVKKYKVTFFINLIGLSTGLASVILIYLWVNDELNMWQFQERDSQRHFQVMVNSPISTGIQTEEVSPGPLSYAIKEEFPEVEYTFPIQEIAEEGVLSFGGEYLRATPKFIGEGYFNVFRCDFISGDKQAAFSKINNVIISEKTANALFENSNQAVGKTIFFNGVGFNEPFVVSGVFKNYSDPSLQFDLLFSYDYYLAKYPFMMEWINGGVQAHLVLNAGVDPDQFNAKIKDFLKTKLKGIEQTLFIQKYSDRYLYGNYENGFPVAGRVTYAKIFSVIALFILVIACINYMNLSTAQASRRIKEIGVKKAIGARKRTLIYQHLRESMFMTFLSFILAIGIVIFLLPKFNEITGKQLSIQQISSIGIPILIINFLTGLISGIYPGFYLSGFKPVLALKGKIRTGSGILWMRKGLVIFQFAISLILIVSVIVIYQQIDFIQTSNLGYDNEHIVSFPIEGKLIQNADAFISEAKNIPGVVSMSYMSGNLPGNISDRWNLQWKDQTPEEKATRFHFLQGDYDMAELLDVELKEGRFLSRDFPTDDSAIVINEAAIKVIKYKNPIGKKIWMGKMYTIVGIVKDFHFEGMHETIKPFFFKLRTIGNNFMVKIRAQNQRETINRIQVLHDSFNPGYPFEFKFIDEDYQELYDEERRVATLSKYFAGIAILISCLGLLGLAIFTASQRRREIGIRKTLGQKKSRIALLLSGEFTKLVSISMIIGLPVAFLLMQNWLSDFAYKITLKPSYFIIAGITTLFLALATVSTQAISAANKNPVDALREE